MRGERGRIAIAGGSIVGDSGVTRGGTVIIEDGRIREAGAGVSLDGYDGAVIEAGGYFVSPGFIDLHIHGAAGAGFSDGDENAAEKIASIHARHGTTGLLATLGVSPLESLEKAIPRLKGLIAAGGNPAILGINLEGPYLNRNRCGALPAEFFRTPDRSELERLLNLGGGRIRIMTLAPEIDNSSECVRLLRDAGVVPAAGHSDATFEESERAFDEGVRHVTHLFNAMSGLKHREPGLAASALIREGVTAELIADGVHVHPIMLKLALKIRGWRNVVLVTDCMRAMGRSGGEIRIYDRAVRVRGGAPYLDDGTLCGSILTMNRAVANILRWTGAPLHAAVALATSAPARVLGIEDRKGSLSRGMDADVVIFDSDLDIKATIIGGKVVYNSL